MARCSESHSEIARKILRKLEKAAIQAHIHNEAATGSIYIRFEDARIGSVRISDHEGIERYKYKWNVRTDKKFRINKQLHGWQRDGETFRFYCTPANLNRIVEEIIDRASQVKTSEWKKEYPPKIGMQSNYETEMSRRISELRAKVRKNT